MQLNLFSTFIEEQKPIPDEQYFYTLTWEEKKINPKTLVHESNTIIKTAQAVYTTTEQVQEMVKFIQSTYSYNGCHIITRHTTKPNLNCLCRKPYIL